MTDHIPSAAFGLLVATGTTAATGIDTSNLAANVITAAVVAVLAYFFKEAHKDAKQRLAAIEATQAKQDRLLLRLKIMNELQTPLIFSLAGKPAPDIDRIVRLLKEPDSPSDV